MTSQETLWRGDHVWRLEKFRARSGLALESSIPSTLQSGYSADKKAKVHFRGVGASRSQSEPGWRLEVLTETLNFLAVQAVSFLFFLFLVRWC